MKASTCIVQGAGFFFWRYSLHQKSVKKTVKAPHKRCCNTKIITLLRGNLSLNKQKGLKEVTNHEERISLKFTARLNGEILLYAEDGANHDG
ncbi:hypothetical protein [Bacillus sp. ISL-55]|uniref:hypothetical protein n=1 Tax=Bacillus sp. ISL-55 TaxID=2819134 RepID=UPI001BE8EC7C|nr:hypothetical protein [Bacillus sp. ISL-55]MBT2692011.1 hypothetical protein [Bacillus sp. ISL-55]